MSSHRWLSRRLCPGTALLVVAAAAALASGCASPEVPEARHVIIPQAVQDVQARQQGASVVLSFTLPNQSTQKEPLAEPPAVEIYRGAVEPGGKPPERVSTKLIYTIPGEMTGSYLQEGKIVFRDQIQAGASAEFIYAVRTRAARNRASAESNRVMARIQPAPEPVGEVQVSVGPPQGGIENFPPPPPPPPPPPSVVVILQWAGEAGADYRIYRAEVAPESAAAATADASKAILRTPLTMISFATFARAAGPRIEDRHVEIGHTYFYIVRRVFLNGKEMASRDPEVVESADSKPAVITVVEAIPLAAPQDVEVVVAPAAANQPAYVSLSWAIGAEAGVAGYAVYRSAQEGVRGVRLNDELLGAPTYRDASAAAGQRYFYSVTAVAGSGLESAPSPAVEAQIPAGQP